MTTLKREKNYLQVIRIAVKKIRGYCKSQGDCSIDCMFFDNNHNCVLYNSPDQWNISRTYNKSPNSD